MGHKQYGRRAGGKDPEYSQCCGLRSEFRRKKSGKVTPMVKGALSDYEPVPFNKTNRCLAEDDATFIAACKRANETLGGTEQKPKLKPSARQYSKWRNKRGIAYQHRSVA